MVSKLKWKLKYHKQRNKILRINKDGINQHLSQTNDDINDESDNSEEDKPVKDIQELLETLQLQINVTKKRIIKEKQSNKDLLPMTYGKSVSYGSEIQIMHYNSKGYFNGRKLCSEYDKSSYKFELSTSFSPGMIFKILPKYRIR